MERNEHPISRGAVHVVSQNLENGVTTDRAIPASDTPDGMKAFLVKEFGDQVGTLYVDRPDGGFAPIGTMHRQDVPYPSSERTFTRESFAIVAAARGRMTPEQREAYLEAVVPTLPLKASAKSAKPESPKQESPKPPVAAKGSAKKAAAKKADAKPTKRR